MTLLRLSYQIRLDRGKLGTAVAREADLVCEPGDRGYVEDVPSLLLTHDREDGLYHVDGNFAMQFAVALLNHLAYYLYNYPVELTHTRC